MKRRDDAAWGRVIERMDLEMDDLAGAEERLRMGNGVPLGREWVEELVARAMKAPAEAPVHLRRVRLWASVAAVLLAAVIIAYWEHLLWSSGTYSTESMSYTQAIALLEDTDQPQPPDHRASALQHVSEKVFLGIEALQMTRYDVAVPERLGASAGAHLARLRHVVRREMTVERGSVSDDLVELGALVRKPDRATEDRLEDAARIAQLAAIGIASIHGASFDEGEQIRLHEVHAIEVQTMTYAEVISLLREADGPQRPWQSALGQAHLRVSLAIDALRLARGATEGPVGAAADASLKELTAVLRGVPLPTSILVVDESVVELAASIRDRTRSSEDRLADLARLADASRIGLAAMRDSRPKLRSGVRRDLLRDLEVRLGAD